MRSELVLEMVVEVVVEVSVIIIFASHRTPAPQSHSAKQINILFVYAENNNYFMVGVVLCTPVQHCMINLSAQMFKVTIYQKCYHLSPDTLTSPLHHVSHSQGIIELCSEEWQLKLILSDSNF